jgi:hypothetical protein
MRKNLYRVCIFFLFGLVSLVSNTAAAQNGGPLSIEIDLKDYIEARHFSPEQKRNIRQTGELSGMGEVEYEFKVPVSGWYRLYAVAGMNSVKFYLDDEFIIYTCFHNPAWPREGRKPVKVINLYLEEGVHRLKLSRMWHWGFGRVQRIFFEPAEDVTGMVRLKFLKDYFVFRRGESFPAMLLAGMGTDPHQISLVYHDARTGEVMKTEDRTIPAGEGVHQSKINLSTDRPGAFIVHIKDQQGRHVARVFQYMVIDTANQPPAPPRLKTELVQTIDCVETKPDYVHGGDTRVAEGPAGSCRESGAMGNVEHGEQASWFAYTLQLPKVQEPTCWRSSIRTMTSGPSPIQSSSPICPVGGHLPTGWPAGACMSSLARCRSGQCFSIP